MGMEYTVFLQPGFHGKFVLFDDYKSVVFTRWTVSHTIFIVVILKLLNVTAEFENKNE